MNTKPTKEEFRDMLDKGMNLRHISSEYDATIQEIFYLKKEYGIRQRVFLLKKTDPRYGKMVKPVPIYDDKGIPIGIDYEYVDSEKNDLRNHIEGGDLNG